MDTYDNQMGKKYLSIAFVVMFIVQLVEILFALRFNEIESYIPKSIITVGLLIAWFYCIAEGFKIAKWALILVCIFTGIHFLYNGYIFYMTERVYYDNSLVTEGGSLAKLYGVQMIICGIIKLSFSLLMIFSKSINIFLEEKRKKRAAFSKR